MAVHHTGALRELPGIAVGDVILIEVELERMILPKKMDQTSVFTDVCERNQKEESWRRGGGRGGAIISTIVSEE